MKMLFVYLMILDVVAVLHFAIELGGHETSSGTRSKLQATLPKPKTKSGPGSNEHYALYCIEIPNQQLGLYW